MNIWKDVKGYEGFYKISNTGDLKSSERLVDYGRAKSVRPEKILKNRVGKHGYSYFILSKHKIKSTKKTHRLVAENFIPNPENKPQVNHINGIKSDNRVENLEWTSSKENVIHAYKLGLRKGIKGSNSHLSKLNDIKVEDIRKKYSSGKISQKKLGEIYDISQSQVHRIIKHKNWF